MRDRIHEQYVEKLKEIGEKLGFDTQGVSTNLGRLDCIWRLKDIELPHVKENIPVVAFEVICSEGQKELKGSVSTLISAKPSLAVFVLIRDEIKKHPRGNTSPAEWLKRIENFVKKLEEDYAGILRIVDRHEDDVDKLYSRIIENKDFDCKAE